MLDRTNGRASIIRPFKNLKRINAAIEEKKNIENDSTKILRSEKTSLNLAIEAKITTGTPKYTRKTEMDFTKNSTRLVNLRSTTPTKIKA